MAAPRNLGAKKGGTKPGGPANGMAGPTVASSRPFAVEPRWLVRLPANPEPVVVAHGEHVRRGAGGIVDGQSHPRMLVEGRLHAQTHAAGPAIQRRLDRRPLLALDVLAHHRVPHHDQLAVAACDRSGVAR